MCFMNGDGENVVATIGALLLLQAGARAVSQPSAPKSDADDRYNKRAAVLLSLAPIDQLPVFPDELRQVKHRHNIFHNMSYANQMARGSLGWGVLGMALKTTCTASHRPGRSAA